MLWEISNPSDKCTLEAPSFDLAAAACLVLCPAYGLSPAIGGGESMPPMILGGQDEWFSARFHEELNAFIRRHLIAVAEVLDSVCYGSVTERQTFLDAMSLLDPAARGQFRRKYEDRQRSSVNRICEAARDKAARLRDLASRQLKGARDVPDRTQA